MSDAINRYARQTETPVRYVVTSTYRPEVGDDMFGVKDTRTGEVIASDIWALESMCELAVNLNREDRAERAGEPEWPTAQDTAEAEAGGTDTSDVVAHVGDLSATLSEARGWLRDCGVECAYDLTTRAVLARVESAYDGGMHAFALDTVSL